MIEPILRVPAHLIRRTQQVHDALFAQLVPDLTSPQFAALAVIDKYPGIEAMRLGQLIGYDIATLGGLITRLIAKQLVTRRVGKHDRRTRQIAITARGKAMLARTMPCALEVQARLLSALRPEEHELFISLHERIIDAASLEREIEVKESA